MPSLIQMGHVISEKCEKFRRRMESADNKNLIKTIQVKRSLTKNRNANFYKLEPLVWKQVKFRWGHEISFGSKK
jgi:hypothetical protein